MVHLPPPSGSTPDRPASRSGLDMMHPDAFYNQHDLEINEKLNNVTLEYQELITRSLNQSRQYHESQLEKIEVTSIDRVMHLEGIINVLEEENARLWGERKDLSSHLKEGDQKLSKMEAKLNRFMSRLQVAEKKANEEAMLNTTLMKNHSLLLEQCVAKDKSIAQQGAEIGDLKEQVRDIMFFLETREKAKKMDEIAGSSVVGLPSSPTAPAPGSSATRKKKKK